MKLSARSRYAARILLELARHTGDSPLSASTLSQQTGVSVQFVEQILKPLKQQGLTTSLRGAAGGHKLARPAAEITLGEVVRLMEKGIQLTVCCDDRKMDTCPRKDGCLTRMAWQKVSQSLERELDSITLASLLHGSQVCPPEQHSSVRRHNEKTSEKAAGNTSEKAEEKPKVAPSRPPRILFAQKVKKAKKLRP